MPPTLEAEGSYLPLARSRSNFLASTPRSVSRVVLASEQLTSAYLHVCAGVAEPDSGCSTRWPKIRLCTSVEVPVKIDL